MIPLIILLWIAVQMNAPLWIYIIAIFGIVMQAIDTIVSAIAARLETKIKKEKRVNDLYNKE